MLPIVGCQGSKAPDGYSPTGPLARVLVDSAGDVRLNGRAISLVALAESLRALQPLGGAVLYARVPYGPEPNAAQDPVVAQVLGTVGELRLPIRLLHPDSLQLPDLVLRR
jgi:hypothetical protein